MTSDVPDPGAAIRSAIHEAVVETGAIGSVWIRFCDGDYCLIEKSDDGWTLECDCGVRGTSEELEVREDGQIMLVFSSARHPASFRLVFPKESVEGVFIRTRSDVTISMLEAWP